MRSMATTQFTRTHGRLLLAVALDPKEVGRRIKAARKRRGWTQLELATQHAHVSPSTVARWEAGKLPPVRELMRIADVLDVPAESFVEPPQADSDVNARLARLEAEASETHASLGRIERGIERLLQDQPVSPQDEQPAL